MCSSNNGRRSQQSSGNAGVSQHFPHGSVVVHVRAPHIDLGFNVGVFVDQPVVMVGEFGDDLFALFGWQSRIVFAVGEEQHVVKVTGFHWSAFREWYRCRWYAAHASRHCWQGGCPLRVWRLYADTVPQGALIGLPILPVLAPCLARHWR